MTRISYQTFNSPLAFQRLKGVPLLAFCDGIIVQRGYRVRAIARTEGKGAEFFGSKLAKGLQVHTSLPQDGGKKSICLQVAHYSDRGMPASATTFLPKAMSRLKVLMMQHIVLSLFSSFDLSQVVSGDLRDEEFVTRAVTGADSIVCCLGTTAFPSKRYVP